MRLIVQGMLLSVVAIVGSELLGTKATPLYPLVAAGYLIGVLGRHSWDTQ